MLGGLKEGALTMGETLTKQNELIVGISNKTAKENDRFCEADRRATNLLK